MTAKTYRVNRNAWRCGQNPNGPTNIKGHSRGVGETCLLNMNGYMCCLGQVLLQAGIEYEEIIGYGDPQSLKIMDKTGVLKTKDGQNSEFALAAITINDDETTTVARKEKALKELGEKHGVIFEFYNGPKPKPIKEEEDGQTLWESPLT